MSLVRISVPNWQKFNPRSDRANYSWFRFENSFFTDQRVFTLTDAERVLYLFCLCELSKKNAASVEIRIDYIAALLKKKQSEIIRGLNTLSSGELISMEIEPSLRRQDDGNAPTLLPATNETNETNETGRTRARAESHPPFLETSGNEEAEAKAWGECEEAAGYYCEQYRLKTNSSITPRLTEKDRLIFPRLYGYVGRDLFRLKKLINAYFFTVTNPFYEKRGWPPDLLEEDFNAIAAKAKAAPTRHSSERRDSA